MFRWELKEHPFDFLEKEGGLQIRVHRFDSGTRLHFLLNHRLSGLVAECDTKRDTRPMMLSSYLTCSRHGIFYSRWPIPSYKKEQRATVEASLRTRCAPHAPLSCASFCAASRGSVFYRPSGVPKSVIGATTGFAGDAMDGTSDSESPLACRGPLPQRLFKFPDTFWMQSRANLLTLDQFIVFEHAPANDHRQGVRINGNCVGVKQMVDVGSKWYAIGGRFRPPSATGTKCAASRLCRVSQPVTRQRAPKRAKTSRQNLAWPGRAKISA